MILSNTAIFQALDDGRLIIDPEPSPRFSEGNSKSPYNTSSVDLRLGSALSIPQPGPFNLDLTKQGGLAQFLRQNSNKLSLAEVGSFILEPHQFVLGQTLERVELPIRPGSETCLSARIEGRSSYARLGLLVHFTAPTVHADFSGTLTLEMINLGPSAVTLRYGAYIAQLIVEEVGGIPVSNPSQFQNQSKPEGN